MRGRLWAGLALLALALAALPSAMVAQALSSDIAAPDIPILTLDQDRLFTGSRFGQAMQTDFDVATQALASENRKIEQELEAEERDLTSRRATLAAAEFRTLAEAFDAKAELARKTQDDKSRALARQMDENKQRFYQAALPILGEMMREAGAVAILNANAIVLSFDRIDMTDEAIAKLDSQLGDGTGLATPAP